MTARSLGGMDLTNNRYLEAITSDFDLIVPLSDYESIYGAMYAADQSLGKTLEDVKPKTYLQLEQLQVADYSAFPDVPDHQREFIRRLNNAEPIRPEEMAFLALRSMVAFCWPEPRSNGDVLRAAQFEDAVNHYLVHAAMDMGPSLRQQDGRLPYWGRLSFLRVMAAFPTDSVTRFRLDQLSVALLKAPSLNARTFSLDSGGAVIGFNYALEPILTCLNRYTYHFFHTREHAGPKRIERAWRGFLPIVLYFWGNLPAFQITSAGSSLFFDEAAPQVAMSETLNQIDFILLHEIGHSVLDHPRTMREHIEENPASTALRHEFEHAADAFALGFLRSQAFNELRYTMNPKKSPGQDGVPDDRTQPIYDYVQKVDSVQLLFTYMSFIDRAGRMLKDRLGTKVKLRDKIDSHPAADDRWHRLEVANSGDRFFTRPTTQYAADLLTQAIEYAEKLDVEDLYQDVNLTLGSV